MIKVFAGRPAMREREGGRGYHCRKLLFDCALPRNIVILRGTKKPSRVVDYRDWTIVVTVIWVISPAVYPGDFDIGNLMDVGGISNALLTQISMAVIILKNLFINLKFLRLLLD